MKTTLADRARKRRQEAGELQRLRARVQALEEENARLRRRILEWLDGREAK